MPQICIYLLGLCEKKWDKNYSQIMSPLRVKVGGGHIPPGPMVAPPMHGWINERRWKYNSAYKQNGLGLDFQHVMKLNY